MAPSYVAADRNISVLPVCRLTAQPLSPGQLPTARPQFNCSALSGLAACAEPQCADFFGLVRGEDGAVTCEQVRAGVRVAMWSARRSRSHVLRRCVPSWTTWGALQTVPVLSSICLPAQREVRTDDVCDVGLGSVGPVSEPSPVAGLLLAVSTRSFPPLSLHHELSAPRKMVMVLEVPLQTHLDARPCMLLTCLPSATD